MPFVLPYLPFLIVFGIAPTIYALELAFTNVDGSWAGFDNFTRTYDDFRFIPAFKHILVYTVVWLGALMVFVVGLGYSSTDARTVCRRPTASSSTSRALWPAQRPS